MTREPGPAASAAGDSGTDWRDDGLRPTWNLYRGMAQSTQNPARREAMLWALGQLENLMGPDWLERYFDHTGHVPAEVNLGSAHVAATGNLLDLALRYYVLAGAPGLDVVRGEMRGDVRDERRWHSALQLEVAALAARDGFTVALEAASPASARPSDVALVRDGQEMRVETFLLLPDEGTQEATAFWDKFSQETLWIGGECNVGISGDIGRRVIGDDYQELLRQIRAAAAQAATTGKRRPVEHAGARLMILPPGEHDYQLNGAVEESRGWPRTESKLMKKARQAAEAGGAGCAPTSVTACGCSPPGLALAWATRSNRSRNTSPAPCGESQGSTALSSATAPGSRKASSTASQPAPHRVATASGVSSQPHAPARP